MGHCLHPLSAFFIAKKWTHRDAMAWLEMRGYLDGAGLPDNQETPYLVRQVPMEVVNEILFAADAPSFMPIEPMPERWVCLDEDPFDAWRKTLPDSDPRKDPVKYKIWRDQQNENTNNETPDDYKPERPRR